MAERPLPHGGLRVDTADPGWVLDPAAALLLVEDDAGDALLVRETLTDSGLSMDVTWRKTLAEARLFLERPGASSVCVLLDLHLPDTQGLDAVRQVREERPDAAVVVLTGLAEKEAGLAAVAAGAQDFLAKDGLDPEALGRAVRYALQRKQVERSAAEVQAARLLARENARLERGLLPVPLLRSQGLRVFSRYRPGRDHALLGGDFFDVVETTDGTLHAVIGDVSGHGAAEAALGVCLRVAWRAAVLTGCVGLALVRLLEEILRAERGEEYLFATVTLLRLDPDRGRLHTIRAGHPGLLVRTGLGTELYEPAPGPALGVVPGHDHWPEAVRPAADIEAVTVFTDGLFEGVVAPGRRLGEDGLLEVARAHTELRGQALVDALVEEVASRTVEYGGLADDVAVLHLATRTEGAPP
ncbi:PP2C family protein-serine/threonine phosphatase [Streptomyces griseoaurantiacus]|uniref:Serine phosphatase RsbU, regulator of sigma subunit n=1 Tax=Streptomyces griseoaurantiacus TaxID=68213 RepID=A0A1G7DPJ8_9ACTN|nr:SpoIIE family protein phosphatase [Streptomyces jietaisiensis]SDE52735.1 Serine phosphatase RsbU, regulator of sigma subunit [Streptomyces jietaisiensis]